MKWDVDRGSGLLCCFQEGANISDKHGSLLKCLRGFADSWYRIRNPLRLTYGSFRPPALKDTFRYEEQPDISALRKKVFTSSQFFPFQSNDTVPLHFTPIRCRFQGILNALSIGRTNAPLLLNDLKDRRQTIYEVRCRYKRLSVVQSRTDPRVQAINGY